MPLKAATILSMRRCLAAGCISRALVWRAKAYGASVRVFAALKFRPLSAGQSPFLMFSARKGGARLW
eukprot:3822167-Lingulodinium_polyedra.AAC.1